MQWVYTAGRPFDRGMSDAVFANLTAENARERDITYILYIYQPLSVVFQDSRYTRYGCWNQQEFIHKQYSQVHRMIRLSRGPKTSQKPRKQKQYQKISLSTLQSCAIPYWRRPGCVYSPRWQEGIETRHRSLGLKVALNPAVLFRFLFLFQDQIELQSYEVPNWGEKSVPDCTKRTRIISSCTQPHIRFTL